MKQATARPRPPFPRHGLTSPRQKPREAVSSFRRLGQLTLWCALAWLYLAGSVAPAQEVIDVADYFKRTCTGCHTIGGGRRDGPDLKNVTQRVEAAGEDRKWLIRFMVDPKGVIDSSSPDSYARKILSESRNRVMPPLGIKPQLAEKLLVLIEEESQKEESQFKGEVLSAEPFTDKQREDGRKLFLGHDKLENGGTACIACHSMYDTPALGGGRLGPDLTKVYERKGPRQILYDWLKTPNTPTMAPIFQDREMTKDERLALVAYFESTAAESPVEPAASRVAFLLMGLVGAAVLIFAFDAIWKRRFHSVRQPLVDSTALRGH